MGRHPFAGRYQGTGDMPIERAIAESRFAYSSDTSRTKMGPPPFTPPMSTFGPAVCELFERAFHPDAGKLGRPSPEAWIDALEALKRSLFAVQESFLASIMLRRQRRVLGAQSRSHRNSSSSAV